MRIWDSVRANSTLQNASNSFGWPGGSSGTHQSTVNPTHNDDEHNNINGNVAATRPQYYEYTKSGTASSSSRVAAAAAPAAEQQNRVNIDSAWNPIDTYIYGPTRSTIFNQQPQYGTNAGQLSNTNQQLPPPSSSAYGNKGANRKGASSASNWDEQYYQPPSSGGANVQQQQLKRTKGGGGGASLNPYGVDSYPGTKYTHNQYSGSNIIDAKYNTYSGVAGEHPSSQMHNGYDDVVEGQGTAFDGDDSEDDAGEEDDDTHYGHVGQFNGGGGAGGDGNYNPYGNINRAVSAKPGNSKQNANANSNNNNINRNNNRNFNNNQQQHVEGFNRYQTMSTSKSPASSVPAQNNNYNNNRNNQRGFGYSQLNPGNNKKSSIGDPADPYSGNNYQIGSRSKDTYRGTGGGGRRVGTGGNGNVAGSGRSGHNRNYIPSPVDPNRRLLLEIYDNESPKLCDHSALEDATSRKTRPCSPLESYVSTGNDMVSLGTTDE